MFALIKTFIIVEKHKAILGTNENSCLRMMKLQVFILLNFFNVLNRVFNNFFEKTLWRGRKDGACLGNST